MQYCEDIITGIDGSEATFVRYVLDNSEEIDPKRQRPSVLVIPGGGYAMTSDREAEPIAMQFLAAGCNAFVLRYSVRHPSSPRLCWKPRKQCSAYARMRTTGIATPVRSR